MLNSAKVELVGRIQLARNRARFEIVSEPRSSEFRSFLERCP